MSATSLDQQIKARIELPKVVTDAQVSDYVEQGFLAVEHLLSADELAELKQDVVKIARGAYSSGNTDSLPPDASEQEVLKSVLCIHQPHHVSPVIDKFVRHPRICGALAQIAGAHLPWWDGSVKCMQSMFFVKPPGFQGQAWHQDEIYIPTRDRSLVGAWIAVDDATIENGCLWVLPGSHRKGYLYPQRTHDKTDEFDGAEESHGFDDTDMQPVEVKAGTLVFFHGYLLHRSQKNRSQNYRRVLVSHYMNAWSLLPWKLDSGHSTAALDHRGVELVAGADPYEWKGYEKPGNHVGMRRCKANESSFDDSAKAK
jgi:phytanoyl-CoA hydroxylase